MANENTNASGGGIDLKTLIIFGILAFLLYQNFQPKNPQPAPNTPVVTPAGPTISAKSKAAADGLAGYPKQAAALGAFYRDFAKVLKATDKVATTGQFRDAHAASLTIFVAADEYSGAPKAGAQIDAAIADAVGGLEDVNLDATKRAALIARLEELSAGFLAVK